MPSEPQPERKITAGFSILLEKFSGRVRRILVPTGRWVAARVRTSDRPLRLLGTRYGGWVMAEPNTDASNRYALLCGAGEDVSFDLALQAAFDLNCIIIDPTPRAIDHWSGLTEQSAAGKLTAINGSSTEHYDVDEVDFRKISYLPFAVWTNNEELKFWVPKDPSHVSHSAANIQNTSEYFIVPAKTLSALSPVPASAVELVKLDVEGVGAAIIGWMIEHDFLPTQILVELEECIFPTKERDRLVKKNVLALEALGYSLVHFDGMANATFLRRNTSVRSDV